MLACDFKETASLIKYGSGLGRGSTTEMPFTKFEQRREWTWENIRRVVKLLKCLLQSLNNVGSMVTCDIYPSHIKVALPIMKLFAERLREHLLRFRPICGNR